MNRKNIGLYYTSGAFWMGGVIYIQNIIRSLDSLPDEEKPNLFIFYNDLASPYISEIEYPYINFIKIKFPNLILGYLISIIIRKNVFENGIIEKYKLNGLFPLEHYPIGLGKNNNKVSAWYPDLQHKFYPEYFSKRNLFTRELRAKFVLRNAAHLVLSSNNVYSHFKQHYNIRKDLKIHILRFTSIIDVSKLPSFELISEKYSISEPYFIVSNQFWKHKDHLTVFKAIHLLKKRNITCKFIFTGNMEDKRDCGYIDGLKKYIIESNISDYTCFVGLLKREEQLCLMKNSLAVVQPSLFEGWSTVIEDAKALGCQVIASDLPVHLEQLEDGDKGFLFKAGDSENLCEIVEKFVKKEVHFKPVFDNYKQLTIDFARELSRLFD